MAPTRPAFLSASLIADSAWYFSGCPDNVFRLFALPSCAFAPSGTHSPRYLITESSSIPLSLQEIVEGTSHLGEDVCHEVLIDDAVIAQQVAREDIELSPIFQHTREQSRVRHICLELVIDRVSIKRGLCSREIPASNHDARIFDPLKAPSKSGSSRSLLDQRVLGFPQNRVDA